VKHFKGPEPFSNTPASPARSRKAPRIGGENVEMPQTKYL
jgi:hypothetical protein